MSACDPKRTMARQLKPSYARPTLRLVGDHPAAAPALSQYMLPSLLLAGHERTQDRKLRRYFGADVPLPCRSCIQLRMELLGSLLRMGFSGSTSGNRAANRLTWQRLKALGAGLPVGGSSERWGSLAIAALLLVAALTTYRRLRPMK